VQEIAVPCSGKLQPEHLLKAFEAGADGVCVLACAEDGCHYLEGSRRMSRRAAYVRALLNELGLDGERLMVYRPAASAHQDFMRGKPPTDRSRQPQADQEEFCSRLAAISSAVVAKLDTLERNPLRETKVTA
jgi:hypothetical protein